MNLNCCGVTVLPLKGPEDIMLADMRVSVRGGETTESSAECCCSLVLINSWPFRQLHELTWISSEYVGLILTSATSRFGSATGITVEEAADLSGLPEQWRRRQEPLSTGENRQRDKTSETLFINKQKQITQGCWAKFRLQNDTITLNTNSTSENVFGSYFEALSKQLFIEIVTKT